MALPLAVAESVADTDGAQAGVEEAVRRLVARELHDRVAQTLTGMLVEVENFKSEQVGWQEVVHQLDLIQSSTREVLASIRQLLHDLRGEAPMGGDFADTISGLAARFEAKTGITAELHIEPGWPKSLNSAAALNLYRIVEEALVNIRLHSAAQNVEIVLDGHSDTELSLMVRDDGRGVDTDPMRPVGFGTIGMRERAVFLGGQLRIDSEMGRGTVVQAVFPKRLLAADPTPTPEAISVSRRNRG